MWSPVNESSNTGDQKRTCKGNSVAGTGQTEQEDGVLGGSSGEKWNGRLADNFVHLKNNIDRLLLDGMEHVEKFKVDSWKTKPGRGGVCGG